jgi:hypothetical protein
MSYLESARRQIRSAQPRVTARRTAAVLAVGVGLAVLGASPGSAGAVSSGPGAVSRPAAPNPDRVAKPAYYVTATGQRVASGTVSADAASSIPVYVITSTNYGYLPLAHACATLGSYGSSSGVECADLYADAPDSALDDVIVFPEAEAYCQSDGGYPQCADVYIDVGAAEVGGGNNTGFPNAISCGHQLGPCVKNGRNYGLGEESISVYACGPYQDNYEIWSVDPAETDPGSGIDLPGDHWVQDASNLASHHVIVCDGSS